MITDSVIIKTKRIKVYQGIKKKCLDHDSNDDMNTMIQGAGQNQKNHSKDKEEEIRPGYKFTKVGWIPDDWDTLILDKIGEFLKGKGVPKSEITNHGQPCLTYGDLYTKHHYVIREFKSFISQDIADASQEIKFGDILFAGSGETLKEIGKCAAYTHTNSAYAGGDIIILRQSKFDPYFLGYLLNTEIANRQKYKLGQGHSVVHIYSSGLKGLEIPLPPLPEQKAIAQVLSTWDKAIENLTQLITEKQQKKKALMQLLLTGKKRFPGFDGEWKEVKIGEYFTERKESKMPDLPLLSIGSIGVYPQTDSNKKDASNADKAKYKRICPDDIGYNTMWMWQGRSALSSLEGIVSPAYTIVTPKENADVLFFSYLFKFPYVVHRFFRNSQGLVDDTLNCKFKDFAIVKVMIPSTKEEQCKIAQLLRITDTEIKALEQKKAYLQDQKKGLMQQLLTGRKRINYTK